MNDETKEKILKKLFNMEYIGFRGDYQNKRMFSSIDIDNVINESYEQGKKEQFDKDFNNVHSSLELLKLKCLCRIRGLRVDIQNGYEFEGRLLEYEELLRHLGKIEYIIADIECAKKYLSPKELEQFEKIKQSLNSQNQTPQSTGHDGLNDTKGVYNVESPSYKPATLGESLRAKEQEADE